MQPKLGGAGRLGDTFCCPARAPAHSFWIKKEHQLAGLFARRSSTFVIAEIACPAKGTKTTFDALLPNREMLRCEFTHQAPG